MGENGGSPERQISDYAMIGNLRCCALISKSGAVDWFCPHKFDAPACFSALIGDPAHGYWRIAPQASRPECKRRYLSNTLVLETRFTTASGEVEVIDFMPVDCHCHIVRIVRGVAGRVKMRSECVPRFAYGEHEPAVEKRRSVIFNHEQGHLILASSLVVEATQNAGAITDFDVAAGEEQHFVLSFAKENKIARPPEPQEALGTCMHWWRDWTGRNNYDGPWKEAVTRSLITLKALTYEPTGAMVAAPTTSLPEIPEGWANWDYRFCWIRDAALVLDIFLRRNYQAEAVAWRDWLMDVATHPDAVLHVVYTIDGSLPPPERELAHLPGFRGARPVRVGNAARKQFQIDLRGELLDVFHLARRSGLEITNELWGLQRRLLEQLETAWNEPDAGIWEFREEGLQLTHSKVLAWVAYDRSIKDAEEFGLDAPLEHWRELREKIRRDVLRHGVHPEHNYFTQTYGSSTTDASLLLIPELGFLPADDSRMLATVKKIEDELCVDGFVYRYKTERYREGSFLPCTFWLANNYMLSGRCEEAKCLFEKALSVCNDVGLLAEEYDPHSKSLLGNFPQSFAHLELINSAELIGAHEHVYRSGEE